MVRVAVKKGEAPIEAISERKNSEKTPQT